MTATFDRDHSWDRNIYLLLIVLAWVGIVMGFGGDIQHHVAEHGFNYPLIVHVHAFLFVGWMILLTVQVLLIRFKRYGIHRKLGLVLVFWALAMTVVGPLTAWITENLELKTPDADPAFLIVQWGDILIFATVTAAAILCRQLPSAHKRLMLLATFHITNAGFARWLGGPLFHLLGNSFWANWVEFNGGSLFLIALLGLYDLVTRRRLHPAYIAGTAWIFACQWGIIWLYPNPAWKAIALHLLGH